MKTLAELRTEIELGIPVYSSTHQDIYVYRDWGKGPEKDEVVYLLSLPGRLPSGIGEAMGYPTLDALITEDIAGIASQSVWTTTKPQGLIERMQSWGLEHKPFTPDAPFAELGIHSDEFPEAKTLTDVLDATLKRASTQDEWKDESTVPLDSQLGQDVARYVDGYFPGAHVTSIQSSYHSGVFVGDYSIGLHVSLEHPVIQGVVLSFDHEDVPSRPGSWEKLLALPGIRLFMTRITLRNVRYGEDDQDTSVTYSIPGMYEEQMEQWCKKQGDGELYGHIETPDMFIITTQLLSHSHEEVEQTAKLLAVQAKAKLEREMSAFEESPNVDNPFEGL